MDKDKKDITPGIEEYLEALFHLQEEGKAVSTKALAEKLSLKPASVSEMVKKLAALKLVRHKPYRGVTLTKNGQKAAASLVRRHRLSERFLADMLGVPWDELHDEACKFEHVISDKVEEKLLEALGDPETCPHGNPIPTADGKVSEQAAVPLSRFGPGESGVIAKITEEKPEFLQYLASLGMLPDVSVQVQEVAPFGGPIIIKIRCGSYAIGRDIAGHIYLKPSSAVRLHEKHQQSHQRNQR
ncbi:MAG: metal-dependent transcriptional regulator [Actinomycetota bacterium]